MVKDRPTAADNSQQSHTSALSARSSWITVLGYLFRAALGIVVLATGGFIGAYFIFEEEQVEQRERPERKAQKVQVITAQKEDYQAEFEAMGQIIPAREVILQPRVEGEVTAVAQDFMPGGLFQKDQLLLEIDKQDYQLQVQQKKQKLNQAQADLELEKGEQAVARQELGLFGDTSPGINLDLMLRKPQLTKAEADVQTASLALEEARLNLQRATINAPFDAQIIEKEVDLGSNVSQGQDLVHLTGTEQYWVQVTVPVFMLHWLEIPAQDSDTAGSTALIYSTPPEEPQLLRQGYIKKLVGQLEEESRQARLLIAVDDPLGLEHEHEAKLLLNDYVKVRFAGRKLPQTIKLPREYLRREDKIWVADDQDQLQKREVQIIFRDADHIYIESGLEHGESVITSDLSPAVENMRLNPVVKDSYHD